jgi:hypothetical protein
MGGIALLDADRVWFPASFGLSWRELPRAGTFWEQMLVEPGPLVVRDAMADQRFRSQPEVQDLGVRFYAGVSLVDEDEYRLGAVFALDVMAGEADPAGIAELARLARVVADALSYRRSALLAAGVSPARIQGWLGVRTRGSGLSHSDSRPGLVVISVAADSPADQAGLRPTDILLAIDGYPLRHPSDVVSALANRALDGLARLQVLRGGRVLDRVVSVMSEPLWRSGSIPESGAVRS